MGVVLRGIWSLWGTWSLEGDGSSGIGVGTPFQAVTAAVGMHPTGMHSY